MAERTSKKVNKQHKKISSATKELLVLFFVIVLIVAYVSYEVYDAIHVEMETITAVTTTVYESLDVTALVVRDEHLITNSSDGSVVVPCVSDGEKVKVNGNIAMVFSSQENAQNYSNLQSLSDELAYYEELENRSAGVATDVENLDNDIIDDVNDYIRSSANYTASSTVADYADDLNDKLTRRQIIIGEDVDFSLVKEELQTQIKELSSKSTSPTDYISTDESGIFSSYTDGLEQAFDYENISDIDVDTLESYMQQAEETQSTDSFGKLIKSYAWYFCCKVTADDVSTINDGDYINVAIKNSDTVYNCQVVSGATLDLGVEESCLVLKCSNMDSAITSMRLEDIEIRLSEYEGFKVPSSAIHIDSDGNKGIYALVANQVTFRKGSIIYSNSDYSIFSYEAEDNEIRLYDQIITQGKDLEDGKVIT